MSRTVLCVCRNQDVLSLRLDGCGVVLAMLSHACIFLTQSPIFDDHEQLDLEAAHL